MMTPLPPEALAAWDRGDRIQAIRLVRERTGLDLAQAKAALESRAPQAQENWPPAAAQVPANAMAALARGETIEAIKLTRQATGLGLKEAKELVERAIESGSTGAATHPAFQRPGLAPGEVPRSTVSVSAIVAVIAIAAAIAGYFYLG